ncbi:DMT family transporter [Hyphomicrobium sp. 802]|uniref:DMT family transporter n=1 Tax=Hyphomicrobium sp. 802 TaxID=1112272 RepID=UPI00045E71ED|nr:DMT family transporter [Hyphomicrobium sp. 802]
MKSSADGWISGLIGVIIFSGSLPATRVAVSGFSPLFLTSARAVIAALLAAMLLIALRQKKPDRSELLPLGIVAAGVVIGFPLLTAIALQHITSAHSIVFIGLLPLATAIFAVVRGGERPKPLFWLFSIVGSATVAGFAFGHEGNASPVGDILMICAIIVCGLGYAEGAKLARQYGGWQVISWALVFAAPAMLLIAIATLPSSWADIGSSAWMGLAYVSVFSMLIGFVFWYRGLAIGGTASVGQLQLLQPFLGLAFAGLVLHEPVAWTMIAATGVVVVCVMFARRFA